MTDAELRSKGREWLDSGLRAAVIEVIGTQGSAPRDTGARMLVPAAAAADPVRVLGTIGGGHLEWEALRRAQALLSRSDCFEPIEDRYSLGPTLGQCCGGSVVLRTSLLSEQLLQTWCAAPPSFTLLLYGGGHVGQAIVRILCNIDCQVLWIDEREEFCSTVQQLSPLPRHIIPCPVDDAEAEARAAPPDAFHLVMTHSHDLDLRITTSILQKAEFAWFGLIGSDTKRARFEHRLKARGITQSRIDQMVCPIGLRGISGKQASVIAVSVVAQMLHQQAAPSAPNRLKRSELAPQFEALLEETNTQPFITL